MKKALLLLITGVFIFTLSSCQKSYGELQIDIQEINIENNEVNNHEETLALINDMIQTINDDYMYYIDYLDTYELDYNTYYDSETFPIPNVSNGLTYSKSRDITYILDYLESIKAETVQDGLDEEQTFSTDTTKIIITVNQDSLHYRKEHTNIDGMTDIREHKLVLSEDGLQWLAFTSNDFFTTYHYFDFNKGGIYASYNTINNENYRIQKSDYINNKYEQFYFQEDRFMYSSFDLESNSSFTISDGLDVDQSYQIMFFDNNNLNVSFTTDQLEDTEYYSLYYNFIYVDGYASYSDNKFYDDQEERIGYISKLIVSPFSIPTYVSIQSYGGSIPTKNLQEITDSLEYTGEITSDDIQHEIEKLIKVQDSFQIAMNDEGETVYTMFGNDFNKDNLIPELAKEIPETYLEYYKSND